MVTRIAAFLLVCCAAAGKSRAQSTTAPWEISAQLMHSLGTSSGGTFFSSPTRNVSQSAVALRATTNLLRAGPFRLRYSAQLLPVMRLGGVEQYSQLGTADAPIYILAGGGSAYGIGVVPLGLDLAAALGSCARLQVGAGVGIAGFSQQVPIAGGRRRNFTAEWDGQLVLHAGGDRWLQLGVRWKHISNGNTAWENPGIDNRMVFAGMSWRVRAPR